MACGVGGLRISTVLVLATSLALSAYSAYLCHLHYEDKYSTSTRAVDSFTNLFNTKVTTKLNIKLACTGAVAVGAGLQFLSSLMVLICAGKNSTKFFLLIETFVILLLISVIACYFSAKLDYENDQQIQFFLGGCILDLLVILITSCVAGAFLRN